MPVPSTITDLSAVAASNSPAGTDSPNTLDDIQRAHASFIRQLHDGTTKPAWSAAFRIPFFDASRNYASASEFVRDESGNVGIGTATPGGWRLAVRQTGDQALLLTNATGDGTRINLSDASWQAEIEQRAGTLRFKTGGTTERARLDTDGNFLLGATSNVVAGAGCRAVVGFPGGAAGYGLGFKPAADNTFALLFANSSGSNVGSVSTTATGTAYNTSSDYRLKSDVAPMVGGLASVMALRPVTYRWKADGSEGEGFIAHELASVCPGAVTGAKDATDEDGRPIYQGIDASRLVGRLVAAIQEQQRLIDRLEQRLAAAGIA